MATFHDRTIAPKFQRGLLRSAGTSCRVLTSAEVVDLVEHREAVSVQAEPKCVAPALLPAEPDTAAQARALHSRRELHQALDYGFALLDALDLSPRGLDIIDGAIARLDAMDAAGDDLEDEGLAEEEPDAEDDDPVEETSLETFGRGFVRCGADDDEDGFDIEEQHDAEQTYEDGSEDEPYPWRFERDAWALMKEAHGYV